MIRSYWRIKNVVLSLFARKTIGARALLIKDNTLLLVKHTYISGWYSVGGAVDAGESPLQALKRELFEEVGVTLHQSPRILGVYYSSKEKRDDYIVMYVCEDFSLTPVTSPEIAALSWFPLDNLPANISPATKRRIEEYLGKAPLSDLW